MNGYIRAHVGEIAAVGTLLSWTLTALFFEAAGRRIGSLAVNIVRLYLALCIYIPVSFLLHGEPWPMHAAPAEWLWLSISAFFGFLVCDTAIFRALVLIGPRRTMTFYSLTPPITALIGYLVMGETLHILQWIGMACTLAGVLLVVFDGMGHEARPLSGGVPLAGIALGITGAVGQSVGLVFSKKGMAGGLDPFRATMIRILCATAYFTILITAIRWWPRVREGIRDARGMGWTAAGAISGPFFGVMLSLLSLRSAPAAVVATILSLLPVTMIPAVIVFRGERVSPRAILGALLAVTGVALIFL